MNSFTHRLLAKMVYKYLKAELDVSLSTKHLVWGSIKPDFQKTPISHFKDERINQLHLQWEKVCDIDPLTDMEVFSEELGVVLHFLCDYFCAAHNVESLKCDIWPHMKYENRVHKVAKKLKKNFFVVGYADYSQLTFHEILEYRHKLYLQRPFSIVNDLRSAYEICMISAQKLFEESRPTLKYRVG